MSAWSGGWFGSWYGDWLGAGAEEADGSASGVVLEASASLVAGTASAPRREIRPSVSGPLPHRFQPRRVNARVPGEILECFASLIPGQARAAGFVRLPRAGGDGLADGAVMTIGVSLVPVLAHGVRAPEISEEEMMLIFAEAA